MGQPSAVAFGVAGLLWLLLCILPGFLAVGALDPRRSALDRLAIAPLVSFGVGFAVAAWLGALHVPGSVWYAPAALVALAVGSAIVVVRRPRARSGCDAWTPDRKRTWLVIGVALAICCSLWALAFTTAAQGWSSVVPSFDGVTHGMILTDVLRGGTLYPPVEGSGYLGLVGVTRPGGLPAVAYPLALHVIAAPVASVTTVSSALLVPLTVMASAWLVLGTVALTRRFAGPRQALAAGVAAAFLAPLFPFWHVYWGPAPLMLAVALVPAATVAVLDVRPGRGLVVPVLAVSGLFALHVTEVLVVATLVALHQLVTRRVPGTARATLFMAASGVLGLLVAAPLLVYLTLAHGAGRQQDPAPRLSVGEAVYVAVLRPFVVLTSVSGPALLGVLVAGVALVALTVVGGRLAWQRPMGRAVAIVVLGCGVVGVLAYVGAVPLVTSPWYGNGDRLLGQAAALVPCLLGIALVSLARRVASAPSAARVAWVVACGAVVVVMLGQAVGVAWNGLSSFAVVTAGDRDAFAWLTAHAAPGERVLNDDTDGSAWMYESSRGAVLPVFGGHPGEDYAGFPDYADRLHLQRTIQDVASDPQTRAEADRWNVRYVMVGERTIKDEPRLIDAEGLATGDGLREVFSSGGAKVYEIAAR